MVETKEKVVSSKVERKNVSGQVVTLNKGDNTNMPSLSNFGFSTLNKKQNQLSDPSALSSMKTFIKEPKGDSKPLKDYGKVLMAKQLLRAVYNNPREKVFKRAFTSEVTQKSTLGSFGSVCVGDFVGKEGSSLKGTKSNTVLENNRLSAVNKVFIYLSSRLEIIVYAMGVALSCSHAKQLISHGKISVNGYVIKQPNYLLKDGDIITSSVNFISELSEKELGYILSDKIARAQERYKKNVIRLGKIKSARLPKRLQIKIPIAASLLINTELKTAIYNSKALFTEKSKKVKLTNKNPKDPKVEVHSLEDFPITGWRNLRTTELKSLLLSDTNETEMTSMNKAEGMTKDAYASVNVRFILPLVDQSKWNALYALAQAYYLRK